MRLVQRDGRPPYSAPPQTGIPAWDQALNHYFSRYPRLCAHVADVVSGPKAQLGIRHVPRGEPFAVLVLNPAYPPADRFDAIQQVGTYLFYLARHIRNAARSSGLPLPAASRRAQGRPPEAD